MAGNAVTMIVPSRFCMNCAHATISAICIEGRAIAARSSRSGGIPYFTHWIGIALRSPAPRKPGVSIHGHPPTHGGTLPGPVRVAQKSAVFARRSATCAAGHVLVPRVSAGALDAPPTPRRDAVGQLTEERAHGFGLALRRGRGGDREMHRAARHDVGLRALKQRPVGIEHDFASLRLEGQDIDHETAGVGGAGDSGAITMPDGRRCARS